MNRLFVTFSIAAIACSTPKTALDAYEWPDHACGDLGRAVCECPEEANALLRLDDDANACADAES